MKSTSEFGTDSPTIDIESDHSFFYNGKENDVKKSQTLYSTVLQEIKKNKYDSKTTRLTTLTSVATEKSNKRQLSVDMSN